MIKTWKLAALAVVMSAGYGTVASATSYVVDTLSDVVAEDGSVSLREAITAANTNMPSGDAAAGSDDGDSISFDPTVFASGGPIVLVGGELLISDDLSIDGTVSSSVNVNIDANMLSRIFRVDTSGGAGTEMAVALTNLDLSNGVSSLTSATDTSGGAIHNSSTLSVTGGTFSNNAATGAGASGGAILNGANATLTVTDTVFASNSAVRAGGAIEARDGSTTTLTNVTMGGMSAGNTAGPTPGNGGGFHITDAGNATITGGSYIGNTADLEGGAIWNGSGMMTIDGATITGNTASGAGADNGGGGVFNNGGTLIIQNSTMIADNVADGLAGSGGGVFGEDGGSITITDSTISDNSAVRAGGGIEVRGAHSLTITDSTMSGNSAASSPGNGGGLHVSGTGTVDITNTMVTMNTAASEGGGLWNQGGTTMTVDSSTITGNTASGNDATNGGGGIFNNNGGTLIVQNSSTISDNIADGTAGSGGGIFGEDGGSITITGGTISGNQANRAGGGIEVRGAHSLTITDTMLTANNVGVAPAVAAPGNGGALHVSGTGTVDITGATVAMNLAANEGGGLWNQAGTTMTVTDTTINMNTASGVTAHDGGGGVFNNRGTVLLNNVAITNNDAEVMSGSGGGILNIGGTLTITGGRITGNSSARAGGGIEDRSLNEAGDTPEATSVTITGTTVDMNTTGAAPGNGGGMHITGSAGDITVDRAAFLGNMASREGGGLWNDTGSSLTIVNTTVSGNSSTGTAATQGGAGVFNRPGGVLSIINSTIAANDAGGGNGGGLLNLGDETTVTLSNTLIGDNSAATGNDLSGSVTANYSLIEDGVAPAAGGNNLTGDAMLAALSGGTHALNLGSIAVNAALSSVCQAAPVNGVDQIGTDRPVDACDIGAFESTNGPVVASNSTVANAPTTVAPGATNVSAVGFGFANNSGEPVTVGGFNGNLSGIANFATDFTAKVYLDVNGDGLVDSGDTLLSGAGGMASISINSGASTFAVDFTPDRSVADGSTENYLVAIDVSTGTTVAMSLLGGGLGLALIGMTGAISRRRLPWVVVAALTGLALSGCQNNDGRVSIPPDPTVQFSVTAVTATGDNSGLPVAGLSLPVTGALITIDR